MLRLNFEPKYSHDRGESQGGASNTAAVSDFNKRGSRFKLYQIPQSFIPINPIDFDVPQSTPIEISQIEAMRNDLLRFQEIPNAENPILISKAEIERNKGSSITTSIEKNIEQANLVTSEIF